MGLQLTTPLEETVFLDLPEEEGVTENRTFVVVRQATQGNDERRAKLSEEASRVYRQSADGESVVEVKQRWNPEEQKRLEVYMTLVDCNIEDENSTPDKPSYLFKFRKAGKQQGLAMSEPEFAEVWSKLPGHWATKIHEAVLQVNPDWNPK